MTSHPFVHLHNHTQYSLLDGAQKIEEMLERTSAFGMKAVAITDHGNLFGAIKFYNQALQRGIRPIVGVEAYVAPGRRTDRTPGPSGKRPYHHLVLLACNLAGYRNLIRLVSAGYLEGIYYRPRIDKEILASHAEGLVALSACLAGEIPSLLHANRLDAAEKAAREFAAIMGEGNFFLEIQDHGMPEQKLVNPLLVSLARRTGIPLVATNDCHFLAREDHPAHEVLLCIQTGKKIGDANRMHYTPDHYFKSGEDMEALFHWLPEAIEGSGRIADRCHLMLDRGEHHLPRFSVPPGMTTEGYFEEAVRRGFDERMVRWSNLAAAGTLRHGLESYRKRLEEEIGMIRKMGFAGYFLVVWDLIKHAREQGIPVGPGRGSAAGSLVAYCLRITDLDPIEYDLLFERFLNPERISMPDIDIDFCFRRRDQVIDYVTRKYGRENVAQIITFGTMAARAVIRDVGRALGLPYSDVDRIAKMIPPALDETIDKALREVPELRELAERDAAINELIEVSRKLEGLTRHASTHAAGVVISPRPIVEFVPLYKASAESEEITTGFAKDEIEEIGLLKMDFLGLKTLTLIDDTVHLLRDSEGVAIDPAALPLDDEATYGLFSKAETSGIFQFESAGMRNILRRMKPDRFEDLIALNALYRPGPIKSGMIEDFIKRRHGQVRVELLHPLAEPILRPTYGVIVYQEQVMQLASALAGYTLGQADLLRKAMGKKKVEVMRGNRERFVAGCRSHSRINEKDAERIFDLMEHFAGYGFNRSHSAAYALVAFQTGYLKAHYPVHFMAALLTSEKGTTDKLVHYIAECQRRMGIPVLPPDVNVSGMDFTVEGRSVRFGLSAVKNVGEAAVESVLQARQRTGGRFRSLWQFCEDVDRRLINKRVLDALIRAGCLDSLAQTRSRLAGAAEAALDRAHRIQEVAASGQGSLFVGSAAAPGDGARAGGANVDDPLPEAPPWTDSELLAGEKETLGFYLTGHPLAQQAAALKALTTHTTSALADLEGPTDVVLGGMVTALRKQKSRKGELMASFQLEDLDGTAEVLVFPRVYAAHQRHLVADSAILVRGRLDPDDERMRLIADTIMPLEGAREALAEAVTVRLTTVGMVDEVLQQLAAAAGRHPGDTPLYLVLENPDGWHATLAAGSAMAVSPSPELTRELEEILGPESVSFRLKRVPPSPRQPWQAGRGADGRGGRAGSPATGPQGGGAGELPPF